MNNLLIYFFILFAAIKGFSLNIVDETDNVKKRHTVNKNPSVDQKERVWQFHKEKNQRDPRKPPIPGCSELKMPISKNPAASNLELCGSTSSSPTLVMNQGSSNAPIIINIQHARDIYFTGIAPSPELGTLNATTPSVPKLGLKPAITQMMQKLMIQEIITPFFNEVNIKHFTSFVFANHENLVEHGHSRNAPATMRHAVAAAYLDYHSRKIDQPFRTPARVNQIAPELVNRLLSLDDKLFDVNTQDATSEENLPHCRNAMQIERFID